MIQTVTRNYHPKCHRSSGPATPRIGKMVNTQLPMSWAYLQRELYYGNYQSHLLTQHMARETLHS